MLRLLEVMFRNNFKHDFKTTKLNSAQLGTTQPKLVLFYYFISFFLFCLILFYCQTQDLILRLTITTTTSFQLGLSLNLSKSLVYSL